MDKFFQFGMYVGAALQGHSKSAAHALEGSAAVMDSPEAEAFDREICKIAAAAFEVDGAGNTPTGQLFQSLAAAQEWSPGYRPFVDSVKRALAKQAALCEDVADEEFTKAALLPEAALLTHDQIGGNMLKTLFAAGALGGAGIGSLGFLLSRNARQSSADNAGTMQKIRAFRQLRKEIEEDMSGNNTLEVASGKPSRGGRRDTRPTYDV